MLVYEKTKSAQKAHQFPDEVRQHGPEHGQKTEYRNGAPRNLRDRQSRELAGARLMRRAEAAFDGAAVAALSRRSQIQTRSQITGGRRLRNAVKKVARDVLLEFISWWLGVNVYAPFYWSRHSGPSE
jgi:hypothetical protein